MRSRAVLTVALLAAAAVVAGCSELPTTGPVRDEGAIGPQPDDQRRYIEVLEAPPRAGMSPEQIVDGFIDAMASYQPGYEVARQYLTEEAGAEWDPAAGVTVFYDARPTTDPIGDETVQVSMTVHGEVGRDGSFTVDDPAARDFDLQLEQVGGEWRIANPVPGILISDFGFDREYQPRNVYFFDPAFEVLVPDVVYLPRAATEAMATLLARRVLEGPSDWLAPAVRSAFPEDAELSPDAVPISDDGVATVELGSDAALAGQDEKERMAAQLTWTLGVLPEVEGVEVLSSRLPLIPGGVLTPRDPDLSGYDPAVVSPDSALYAIADTGVVSVVDGDLAPVAGALGELAGAREVAVNVGGNRAVVVDDTGTTVQIASFGEGEELGTLVQGVDLSSLAWDRSGLVWAVDHGVEGPGILVTRPDGQPVTVDASELAGMDVTRLAVSPDGARVALVVDGQARVANIVRDPDNDATILIDQLRPIGPDGLVRDVAWAASSPSWSAADTVVVLVEVEEDRVEPHYVGLSGQDLVPGGSLVRDGVRVAGSPGLPVVIESADGVLSVQRSGNTWAELGPARHPTYPG